jgi:hypothetical protein
MILISEHVDMSREYLEFRLWPTRDTLMTRKGGNEMCLNDIDPWMKHYVKCALLGKLIGNGLGARLQRLLVNKNPKAVLAIVKEVWQLGDDEDAVDLGGEVDGARLLCFVREGKDV